MSGVLIKIKSIYNNLPKAQRSVANYAISHPDKFPYQSVTELAKATNVSVASVSRLSKKLGYDNFSDFKISLAQDLAGESIGTIFESITADDSDKSVIEKVFRGNIKSLEDTFKIIDNGEILKSAKLISNSPRVVFFGIGSSGNIARDAAIRFSSLNIQAEAYSDPQEVLIQSLRMQKSEVAVGISHSGRTKITIEALKCASENEATTIGISNYMESQLHEYSEFFLCTAFPESRVHVAALSSVIAQICIIDVLYLLTARYKGLFKKAELLNSYAEEILRIPVR